MSDDIAAYNDSVKQAMHDLYLINPFRDCPQCGYKTAQLLMDARIYYRALSCLSCGFYAHEVADTDEEGNWQIDRHRNIELSRQIRYGYGVWHRRSVDGRRREKGVFGEFVTKEFKEMLARETQNDPEWDSETAYVTHAHPKQPSCYESGSCYLLFLLGDTYQKWQLFRSAADLDF